MATFGDLKAYLERDGWTQERNLVRGRRRTGDHWRYRKDLPDGRVLRTKVPHAVRDAVGPDLFKHILRDPLSVTENEFWAVVRGESTTPRGGGPAPRMIPGWLVQLLVLTVGLTEAAIAALTPEEAQAAWDVYRMREGA